MFLARPVRRLPCCPGRRPLRRRPVRHDRLDRPGLLVRRERSAGERVVHGHTTSNRVVPDRAVRDRVARNCTRRDRAVAPVLGVSLLVLLVVLLAAVVGAAALGEAAPPEPAPATRLSLAVDGDRLTLTHAGGAAVDARRLTVRVAVDGTALAHQPPVPFVGARGFRGSPGGPFNAASDPAWTVGETATLTVAGTNRPALVPGARVEVVLSVDGAPFARLEATA